MRDDLVRDVTIYTGCPKIKLALGKHLELALNGFQMGIFNPKTGGKVWQGLAWAGKGSDRLAKTGKYKHGFARSSSGKV